VKPRTASALRTKPVVQLPKLHSGRPALELPLHGRSLDELREIGAELIAELR
jgi:hypothetical protein